ncbi:MAG: response regulator [Patescibacteria group bacterium]|jgi:DNA-binding response OmpR family regulator
MATKVLIVEDDKFLAELISTKLDKEGYSVVAANDGETGLKKAQEDKPNIILLDIMLPGMDGFEVLENLKKDPASGTKDIPVIILSNFGQEEKVEKGLSLGAADYLVKANFTTGEIVQKIKDVLSKGK